jgi:hypothetical protein
MRGALLALYATLDVQAVRGADGALDALDYVQDLAQHKRRVTRKQQTVAGELRHAPLDHLGDRWRRHVLHGRTINANNYEAAAFEALKEGLRSGDLFVRGSHRYRSFESYLLAKDRWHDLQTAGETRLAMTLTAQEYLAHRQQLITDLLTGLQRDLERLPWISIDAHGKLHLAALEADTPPEVKAIRQRVYRKLPRIPWPNSCRTSTNPRAASITSRTSQPGKCREVSAG